MVMKKLLLILFFITTSLFSEIIIDKKVRVVEGIAEGINRDEAVNNALIEALGQLNGVYIKKQTIVEDSSIESSRGDFSSFKYNSKIEKLTKGKVDSYSILNVEKIDDKNYQATVSITKIKITKRYKTPGLNPNKRRKLAVIPFEYKDSYTILNKLEVGKQVSDRFTQALVTKITQTRKFTILDRENSKYYQAEKNFINSGDSDKDELLKLGKRLGVDYLLIGKILDLSIQKITSHNNIGLPETSRLICNTTISYRILAMATQQIKWSETISKEFEIHKTSNQNSTEALFANASNTISQVIVSNITGNIYPIKIVSVTSNSIILNQGGNGIKKGDIYQVYKNGQRLVDPYTNEFLGYEEIKSGEIEIRKVSSKISYARLLRGKIAKGMVLRKDKTSNSSREFKSDGEAVTDVKINKNGGVVLPF